MADDNVTDSTKSNNTKTTEDVLGINFNFFTNDNATVKDESGSDNHGEPKKRGPGRPPKKVVEAEVVGSSNNYMVPANQSQQGANPNEPYAQQYNDTNDMLKNSIYQIDSLNSGIVKEISRIRDSKTLRKKFEYISELSSTASNLLGTKISAIREINKTKTDCNNMELRRTKEFNLVAGDGNDDKRIMDMYNAFVNTPVSGGQMLGPSMADITLQGNNNNIIRANLESNSADVGYQSYLNNITPEQNRMRVENNPNVKTVVVYDQSNGTRYFEIMDITTGKVIPNVAKPDAFLLEDTQLNLRTGIAVNSNIGMQYPLIIIGKNDSILNY